MLYTCFILNIGNFNKGTRKLRRKRRRIESLNMVFKLPKPAAVLFPNLSISTTVAHLLWSQHLPLLSLPPSKVQRQGFICNPSPPLCVF